MSDVREMREKAWKILWQSKWLNRFVFLIVAFGFIRYAAINIAISLLGSSVNTLNERLMAAENPEEVTAIFKEPTFFRSFLFVLALSLFVAAIIDAIAAYGLARVRLCVANGGEPSNWQRMGFSGFRDPFGLFSLGLIKSIFILWPLLILLIPIATTHTASDIVCLGLNFSGLVSLPLLAISLVAFYRYSQAWFLKATHSNWSALKCLRESNRMMAGHKWQNFRLDCAFWRPISLMLLTMLAAVVLTFAGAPSILVFLTGLVFTAQNLYLNAYIPLGQAVFHLELTKAGETEK